MNGHVCSLKWHRDAWYLLRQSPLCILNNPSLSQQYEMCRVLLLCNFYIKYCKIVLINVAIATLNRFMLLS